MFDQAQALRNQRVQERLDAELKHFERSVEDMEATATQVVLSSSSSSSSDEEESDDDDPSGAVGGTPAPKRARINIMSPGLASALDRTNISSRNATFVLTEVAASLGHDASDFNINRNSIHRARAVHRATMASNLSLLHLLH